MRVLECDRFQGVEGVDSGHAKRADCLLVGLPRLSLSQRLFLLTALALAPALSILAFNEISLRQSREAEVATYALRLGELASLEMERVVTGAAALMVAMASAPVVQGQDSAACADYLNRLQRQLPQLSVIAVTDPEGALRCATSSDGVDISPRASENIRDRLGDGVFLIGEYVETSQGPALQLAATIRDEGAPTGYVVVALSLQYLGDLLRQREFVQGNALTITDHNGTIIAREPFPERFVGTQIPEQYQELVRASEPGTRRVVSQDGTERIIGYYPAAYRPAGLYISAGVATADAFAPIDEATRRGLALAVVGGLLAMLLAWLLGRAFIRQPVGHLTATISAWQSGNLSVRTGMSANGGEIDSVGASIDRLLDQLATRQSAQEAAERHRDLLNAELDHRIKNLLSTVQAIAAQTFRRATDMRDAMQLFSARLGVLGEAHRVLTARNWTSAPITETVDAVLMPFDTDARTRFAISGPEFQLRAKAALTLSMALHELGTNALKYGALSGEGQVAITWRLEKREGEEQFVLEWRESGGPPVAPPQKNGFGSRMIEQALTAELGAAVELVYDPDGVHCTIVASSARVIDSGEGAA